MAGRVGFRADLEAARQRIGELEEELAQSHRLLAIHAPGALLGDVVPPPERFDDDVATRIMAMGAAGMSEADWIAEFNLSRETWDLWKLQDPEMMQACQRAHAQMLAFWSGSARKAITSNNTRFPMTLYREYVSKEIGGGSSKGDASSLVRLDLTGFILEVTDKAGNLHEFPLPGGKPRHKVTLI